MALQRAAMQWVSGKKEAIFSELVSSSVSTIRYKAIVTIEDRNRMTIGRKQFLPAKAGRGVAAAFIEQLAEGCATNSVGILEWGSVPGSPVSWANKNGPVARRNTQLELEK